MFSEPREEATRRFLDRIIAAGRMQAAPAGRPCRRAVLD